MSIYFAIELNNAKNHIYISFSGFVVGILKRYFGLSDEKKPLEELKNDGK